MSATKIYCEKCGKELDPKKVTYLEYSLTDDKFYKGGEFPKGHDSQGCFPFGPSCKNKPEFNPNY